MKILLAALLFLLALPLQALTQEEVNNYLKQTIIPQFSVSNMSASDALALVQTQANLNKNGIFFDIGPREKMKKTPVTLNLGGATAYDAISQICLLAGVQFAVKRDQVRIFETGGNAGP